MLFIAAVYAADTVLKSPERSVAPREDRSLPIVSKGDFAFRLLRHDTVKSLSICHRDLTFLPHVFRAAVGGDLEAGSLLQSLLQLANIFYNSYHVIMEKGRMS